MSILEEYEIIHGNLCCSNILRKDENNFKLCGFSNSCIVSESQINKPKIDKIKWEWAARAWIIPVQPRPGLGPPNLGARFFLDRMHGATSTGMNNDYTSLPVTLQYAGCP